MVKRVYSHSSRVLNFEFVQNKEDFIVQETPIYFTQKGNFLILKIKKTNMDTWELIDIFAKFLNIFSNEIGYAGLKDKKATTTQYISIPKRFTKNIKGFSHNKIEILETYLHNKSLNIGDLKGNHFKINLYKVSVDDLNYIQRRLKVITKKGLLNYFGFQRFGIDMQENLIKAKKIIDGDLFVKDRKLNKMLIMSYQSSFFNSWLVHRFKASNEFFDLIDGDVFLDVKKDKYFTPKSLNEAIINSYINKDIIPTGLLPGRRVFRAIGHARQIEKKFDDEYVQEKGYRREAIVYPKDIDCKYSNDLQKCTLSFSLPKGSYATVLIEAIANKNFSS
ncbi:MAG: tRNA pseudouridine(13) synthase TruD [Campylobacterota bacterium]